MNRKSAAQIRPRSRAQMAIYWTFQDLLIDGMEFDPYDSYSITFFGVPISELVSACRGNAALGAARRDDERIKRMIEVMIVEGHFEERSGHLYQKDRGSSNGAATQ